MRSKLSPFLIVACAVASALSSLRAQPGTIEPQNTIITSEGPLEMRNDGVEASFLMTKNVRLVGTNLEVTCDRLEVFAESKERGEKSSFGGISGIRRVIATGNVVIMQEGRRATAGRAEVLPVEDRIELTENPVLTDPQGTVEGERIEILRGEQHAVVHNPRLILRALPNLGFPRRPEETPPESAPAPEQAPAPAP